MGVDTMLKDFIIDLFEIACLGAFVTAIILWGMWWITLGISLREKAAIGAFTIGIMRLETFLNMSENLN